MKRFKSLMFLMAVVLSACQQEYTVKEIPEGQSFSRKEILWMIRDVDPAVTTRAVGIKGKYWQPGDTIKIKFLNTPSGLPEKVKGYASEWLKYANLKFEYVDQGQNADVKIGFDLDTRALSWSVIGTDCKTIPQDEPSLNFVWLEYADDEDIKAEVLRGFGHVLGLGFEFQNPTTPIRFKASAKTGLMNNYSLSEQEALAMMQMYTRDQTNYTAYDKNSIMTLDISAGLLETPQFAPKQNKVLSKNDTLFVRELYPFYKELLMTLTFRGDSVRFYNVLMNEGTEENIEVDWGDGTREVNVFKHIYHTGGEYVIQLYGSKTVLKRIECIDRLVYADVDNCKSLHTLAFWYNELTFLDVSQNTNLGQLFCQFNPLDSLRLNANLEYLSCHHTPLSTLDLSGCSKLVSILVHKNQLSSLDVSGTGVSQIVCYGNPFVNDAAELLKFANSLPFIAAPGHGKLSIDPGAVETIRPICESKGWEVAAGGEPELKAYNKFRIASKYDLW